MDALRRSRPAYVALLVCAAVGANAAVGATAVAAEAEEMLTLERALALAETGNWHLKAMAARVEGARAATERQRAERLPRLDATAGFQRTDNPVAVFGNLLLQERFGAENFALDRLNRPAPLDDWSARLEATYPLWTGGRQKHAVAAAEHRFAGAQAQRARGRHEVVAEVVARYGDAVVAERSLVAAEDALRTAEAHVALARDRVETGLAVASDLLMAEVRASAAREGVVRAESAVDLARAALNLIFGRDLSTPFSLPATLAMVEASAADTLDERSRRAQARRPDLAAAQSALLALTSATEVARAGHRPRLDLSAGVEAHAEDPADHAGTNAAIGLHFAVPLFDGGRTRARRRGAEARVRTAEAELAQLREAVAFDVRAAFLARRSAEQRLRLTDAAIVQAERSLCIVEDRYREGLTTFAELLDAQVALADANVRQIAAQRDLVLANAQLDLASGDLPKEL